jgi:hypothetical protein
MNDISHEEVAEIFYDDKKLKKFYHGKVPNSLLMSDIRKELEKRIIK